MGVGAGRYMYDVVVKSYPISWWVLVISWSHTTQLVITANIHCVSKNVPPLTCYNLDVHHPITIIFGRSVTENVRNQTIFVFPPHLSSAPTLSCEIGNLEDSALHWCIVCATQCNFCSVLDFVYLKPSPPPNSPELNALITRFRESYSSVSVSRESERLKKSSSWLYSGNGLIQHLSDKFNFRVSPFC